MGARVALDPPARSPAREQLSVAVAKLATLRRTEEANSAAQAKIFGDVWNAQATLTEIEKRIEAIGNARVKALLLACSGEDGEGVEPPPDATAAIAERDAQRQKLKELRAVQLRLQLGSGDIACSIDPVLLEVRSLAREVVRLDPAVRALTEAYTVAARTTVDLRRVLEMLAANDALPHDVPPGLTGDHSWPELNAVDTWRATLAALEGDADAPLPDL
jgi:hypothetical protein